MITTTPYITQKLNELEDIYTVLRLNNLTISKSMAAKIAGGRYTLERLVAIGKIRMKKIANSKNGKWFCVAEDVFRFANYKEKVKQ